MNRRIVIGWVGWALCGACGLSAQAAGPSLDTGVLWLGVHGGGAAFTDFQRGQARSVEAGLVPDFQRRISAQTAVSAGLSATYWVRPGVGVRLSGGYLPSRFHVVTEDWAQQYFEARSGGTAEEYAGLDVWLVDGSLLLRTPFGFGRVQPFVIMGVGQAFYDVRGDEELPPEARDKFASRRWSGTAGVVGLGAALPLERHGLQLTFELTDHITRTALDDRGSGQQFVMGGIPLELNPDGSADGTDGVGLASHVRLMLAVNVPLRRAPRR